MFEVRLHGRGGQGVVTGAALLSLAAFRAGLRAQAFPSFGSERMGAPVVSYCRIARGEIRSREPVVAPDAVIVQDPTLLHSVDVFGGLDQGGYVIVNSRRSPEELGLFALERKLPSGHVQCVPATEIALEHLGRPIPNAVLLGAFAALTGVVDIESLVAAIGDHFPPALASRNSAAARAARGHIIAPVNQGERHAQTD